MNFWTMEKIKDAIPGSIFYNFFDDWSSSGLKIWHDDFQEAKIALMRSQGDKRGILDTNLKLAENSPCAIMCSAGNVEQYKHYNLPIIEVPDNDDAILSMAKYIRKYFEGKVVVVTGSSGKSTVTRMVYDVLSRYGASCNLNQANTSWGISWNMTNFLMDSQYWAIETSLGGGLIRNSSITLPDIAVVTNVAPVHLREGQPLSDIANEKSKVFSSMQEGQTAVIFNEMSYFDIVASAAKAKGLKIITFGENDDADVQVITGEQNKFKILGKEYILNDKLLPHHILIDMAVALAVVYDFGLSIEEAIEKLNEFQSLSGRGEIFKGNISPDRRITFVDESYNANPLSMSCSLNGFVKICPKNANKVLILGDMSEGGSDSLKNHLAIAKQIQEINPARILLCGPNMKDLWKLLKTEYAGEHYEEVTALNSDILNWIKDGDFVFLKASHSIGLYRTVNVLKNFMNKY